MAESVQKGFYEGVKALNVSPISYHVQKVGVLTRFL